MSLILGPRIGEWSVYFEDLIAPKEGKGDYRNRVYLISSVFFKTKPLLHIVRDSSIKVNYI